MYIRVWASHEQYQEDLEKLINVLSLATDAIVHCFSGKCGSTCDSQSFVCRGLLENCWPKEYLPPHARKLQSTENQDTLRHSVNYRFSRNTSNRYETNAQKPEAIQRGYSKSNPKSKTCFADFEPHIFFSRTQDEPWPRNVEGQLSKADIWWRCYSYIRGKSILIYIYSQINCTTILNNR